MEVDLRELSNGWINSGGDDSDCLIAESFIVDVYWEVEEASVGKEKVQLHRRFKYLLFKVISYSYLFEIGLVWTGLRKRFFFSNRAGLDAT